MFTIKQLDEFRRAAHNMASVISAANQWLRNLRDIPREEMLADAIANMENISNGAIEAWAEADTALTDALDDLILELMRERDHYKAKTSASLGFTHEPTGRRITVYAADKATLDALLYTPGIVEALREIHHAPKSTWIDGPPSSGAPV